MPQLSIETFVSQYFWFITIFLAFYIYSVTQVIPRITEIMKTRKKCVTDISTTENTELEKNPKTQDILKNLQKNVIFMNDSITINDKNNINNIKKTSENWVKERI